MSSAPRVGLSAATSQDTTEGSSHAKGDCSDVHVSEWFVAPARGAEDPRAAPEDPGLKQVKLDWLENAEWDDSRMARGDLATEITALKAEPGRDIIAWGGATFVQSLSRAGLVDEYRLVINPVALGRGLPLFKDLPAPVRLRLVQATTYDTGAALHVYRTAAQ